jgi:hypothetical protein
MIKMNSFQGFKSDSVLESKTMLFTVCVVNNLTLFTRSLAFES